MGSEATTDEKRVDGIKRRIAGFHPSPWGKFFLTHVFETDQLMNGWNEEIEVLKENVCRMFLAPTADQLSDRLDLVNVVDRLGIGYHFEGEIRQVLRQAYETYDDPDGVGIDINDDHDLRIIALRFRLLRQHGYQVSCDIFKKFTTEEGEFKKNLVGDTEGILSFYEAAYLRNQGESILDDAVQFTKSHLISAVNPSSELPLQPALLVEQIDHALERPLRKGVAVLEHLFFISVYEKMAGHDVTLLKLAKLSFNVLQNMYQKELKVLTKWWIDLDLIRRNDYARDKLVEVYFWAVGCLWEPKFELARYTFTTITTIGSVFDDTYDAYGSLDELELFTAAIERWDPSMHSLNGKMKVLFEAMITGFDEIDIITSQEGRSYCLEYAKLSLKNMTKLYMEEARWLAKAYVPTLEEYRHISSLSTTYQSIVCATLCGLGTEVAPKEVFDWLFAEPNILVVSSDHCRLMDDIMSHKFEQERGHVASSVECYMLQYGVSNEEAVDALNEMVEEDWKIINRELLDPPCRHIPKEVLSLFLGFEQVMDVLYKYSDGYTHSDTTTKDMLTTLLVVPLPIAP